MFQSRGSISSVDCLGIQKASPNRTAKVVESGLGPTTSRSSLEGGVLGLEMVVAWTAYVIMPVSAKNISTTVRLYKFSAINSKFLQALFFLRRHQPYRRHPRRKQPPRSSRQATTTASPPSRRTCIEPSSSPSSRTSLRTCTPRSTEPSLRSSSPGKRSENRSILVLHEVDERDEEYLLRWMILDWSICTVYDLHPPEPFRGYYGILADVNFRKHTQITRTKRRRGSSIDMVNI
ncbi:methyl-CPG-binding domain protein 02 [Striga asiatica]|uniref:Methyl-CPG-binding domain protein 02 n=1 Tax=Striga asiatica TaxID=4170 RepID=A0A5A7PUK9_STRAF|nr:methyl-CPG-binding domain protein 02 [Striga asiatica]